MSYPKRNPYQKVQVTTASRGQVLIMLYEACIKNVKKASQCIDQKDLAGKGVYILKAHDIINELNTTLDFNIGGEVAQNLSRLYNFTVDQLVKANLENSKEPLQSVQKILENLLEGWRIAVSQAEKEASQVLDSTNSSFGNPSEGT